MVSEEATTSQKKRGRLWAILGGSAVILAVVLYFLPSMLLRDYAEDYLADYGMQATGLEDVHFNVFNLGLETGPLTVSRQGVAIADLDGLTLFLRLAPLGQQRVDVTGARLDGLHIGITQSGEGDYAITGLPDMSGEDDASLAWVVGLTSLELVNAEVELDIEQLSGLLQVDVLNVGNLKAWTPETPGSLNLRAQFLDSTIVASLGVRPFTEVLDLEFDLEVDSFPLDRLRVGVPVSGKLSVDMAGDVSAGDKIQISARGDLGVSEVKYEATAATVAIDQVDVEISALSLQDVANAFALTGQAELTGSGLTVYTAEGPLASIDAISSQKIELTADSAVSVASITFNDIAALSTEDEGGVNIDQLTLAPVSFQSPGMLALGDIGIQGLSAGLHLSEAGIAELAYLAGGADDLEEPQVAEPEEAFSFSINSVQLIDEGELRFIDQTMMPEQSFTLSVNTLTMAAIDATKPDNPTALTLIAALGDYTHLTADGWVKPLAENGPDFDLKGSIKSLELPIISAYAASAAGLHLRAGRLDMDFAGTATAGALDAQTDWLIQHIELEELDEFDKERLLDQADIPLEKAVNLLQDKDGNITLDIPISGALNDPSFGLSSTISKAVGNAVQGALVTTLKILFPISFLAGRSDDDGLKFDAVAFPALSSAPEDVASKYIESLANLMADRPKMTLLICGVASRSDLRGLRDAAHQATLAQARELAAPYLSLPPTEDGTVPAEVSALRAMEAKDIMAAPMSEEENVRLTALAEERQSGVRSILVDGHAVDNERLFACRSKVDVEGEAPPRVDVSL
jgi:hypothetical protein